MENTLQPSVFEVRHVNIYGHVIEFLRAFGRPDMFHRGPGGPGIGIIMERFNPSDPILQIEVEYLNGRGCMNISIEDADRGFTIQLFITGRRVHVIFSREDQAAA